MNIMNSLAMLYCCIKFNYISRKLTSYTASVITTHQMQEDGIGLLTIIKGTCMYRPSRRHDLVRDFIPPSMTEFRYAMDQVVG